MNPNNNKLLIIAATCSALVAIAHLGCIVFGADWYRFFGAGEAMAKMAEAGHWYPTVVTVVIVALLSIWSLYALSGARVIKRLPLLRLGLIVISAIYILRGIAFVGIMPMFPENSLMFWFISSSISLSIGLLYGFGTYKAWSHLSAKTTN
ncbi:MAG: hypothetical protein L3J24_02695 [Xanthomonadales bacterium]|nr:hypothetical protein [Xanthomonadales bacterium]